VLSGRGLCVGLITHSGWSYQVWCAWVWSWSLHDASLWPARGCWTMEKKLYIPSYYLLPEDLDVSLKRVKWYMFMDNL